MTISSNQRPLYAITNQHILGLWQFSTCTKWRNCYRLERPRLYVRRSNR